VVHLSPLLLWCKLLMLDTSRPTTVCAAWCSELWGMSFPEPYARFAQPDDEGWLLPAAVRRLLWWTGCDRRYMTLFNHSSRAVKDVDSRIKIGGPATMQLNYLTYFAQECERRNISYDFVSSHMYPNVSVSSVCRDARLRAHKCHRL
jgi:hypothetical protein